MSNDKYSPRSRSWAMDACDYENTREILHASSPLIPMLIVLLAIFAIFCVPNLFSQPAAENNSLAYVEESPAYNAEPDEKLPGPDEPVATDRAPELISSVSPEYPLEALRSYKSGTVWVKALVDKQGNVRKAIVERDSGEKVGFEEAALEAAAKRKYHPAQYEHNAVAVWVSYEVSFQLKMK